MGALTAARGVPVRYGRKVRQKDVTPISSRWRYVLELHLAGRSPAEIQEITGYSPAMMYLILADPRMVAEKQQIMRYYDSEFEALYARVINVVRENLECPDDPKVRNDAAKIWLKSHGKFQADKEQSNDTNISAEKIVFQILNQAKEERKAING